MYPTQHNPTDLHNTILYNVQVALLRLLKQLSEVYSTMRVSALAELASFMPMSEVEAAVVDAVKNDFLQVCVGSVSHEPDKLQHVI